MLEGAVSITHRTLYSQDRPGTHCTGGWVGLRASQDKHGKFALHQDSNPRPSSP